VVDELSVDVLSVDKKSVDEMSVDGLSPHPQIQDEARKHSRMLKVTDKELKFYEIDILSIFKNFDLTFPFLTKLACFQTQ
jgi:hypothetical protein